MIIHFPVRNQATRPLTFNLTLNGTVAPGAAAARG